jgi:hypothetical protein
LAWPIVAAFALYLLRRPLVELVGQVARRAKKLSVFEVSVELATLPELAPQWSVAGTDVRRLSSSQIFDTASQALFQELLKPAQSDYAIVDVRSGQAWLTSRLFIFSLVLGEVTGLRAFVFLETAASTRRKFPGRCNASQCSTGPRQAVSLVRGSLRPCSVCRVPDRQAGRSARCVDVLQLDIPFFADPTVHVVKLRAAVRSESAAHDASATE